MRETRTHRGSRAVTTVLSVPVGRKIDWYIQKKGVERFTSEQMLQWSQSKTRRVLAIFEGREEPNI